MTYYYDVLSCPAGRVLVVADESGSVTNVRFLDDSAPERILVSLDGGAPPTHDPARTAAVRTQLEEYFAGRRRR